MEGFGNQLSLLSNFINNIFQSSKPEPQSVPQKASSMSKPLMTTSEAGMAILKQFEACRLSAYQDDRGIWTIGWGHTGPEVVQGYSISQQQAESIFHSDLHPVEQTINNHTILTPTQNQFDAMTCLTYNIGSGAFVASTLLRRFNAGDNQGAADAFLMWNKEKVNGIVRENVGLKNRRNQERTLFLGA